MNHQTLNGGAIFGIFVATIIGLILFIFILIFLIEGIKYFKLRQKEIYKNNPDLIDEEENKKEENQEIPE